MLVTIRDAYQSKCDELGYAFKFGDLQDVINIPSNADGSFIWMDRPVNGAFDAKLAKTGVGKNQTDIVLYSLQPFTQNQQANSDKAVIWDLHNTRLIEVVSGVNLDNLALMKGIGTTKSSTVYNFKIHEGVYIGMLIRISYNLDYCG